jgi:DNA-directed RNA polymerase specialized sigma24 family protein
MTVMREPTVSEIATVAHGYTMAEINRIARLAVTKHRFSQSLNWDDRLASAWHGVVVELCSRRDPPTFTELLHCGIDQIRIDQDRRAQFLGRPDADGQSSPNFIRYWGERPSLLRPMSTKRTTFDDGFSERLCENLSLKSVLSVLSGTQYEALVTLAAFDNDYRAAADSLGLTLTALRSRVDKGRAAVKQAWFDEETPPARRAGVTCKSGHLRAEWGRKKESGSWECRKCTRISNRKRAREQRERERSEAFEG